MSIAPSPAKGRQLTFGEMLGNAGLGCFLALAGAIQLIKIDDALRDGARLVALYQALICLSNMVMAGLVIARRPAVAKGQSWTSRAVAVIGSFAILPLGALPLTWAPGWLLAATSVAMIASYIWIIWALMTLRRSFSVFAEARALVTHGPYGIVRHPLYAAYFLTYTCSVLPKLSPLAMLLVAIGITAEVLRSRNEERILGEAFPSYAEYARQVPAFFPLAIGILARGGRDAAVVNPRPDRI